MLWSPNNQGSIAQLESVARNFTSQIAELDNLEQVNTPEDVLTGEKEGTVCHHLSLENFSATGTGL